MRTGKPFEIIFENSDLMPHNFALAPTRALESRTACRGDSLSDRCSRARLRTTFG